MRIDGERRYLRCGRQRLLVPGVLVTLFATAVVGCGGVPTEPPPQPEIELSDGPAPPLPPTTGATNGLAARLLARLVLQGGHGLYVGEWPSLPINSQTARYFVFEGDYPEPEEAEPEQVFSDDFRRPVELHERGEYLHWPDVTVGTVDASIDQVRLTFEGACPAQTYEMTGPLLRQNPPGSLHVRPGGQLPLEDRRGDQGRCGRGNLREACSAARLTRRPHGTSSKSAACPVTGGAP